MVARLTSAICNVYPQRLSGGGDTEIRVGQEFTTSQAQLNGWFKGVAWNLVTSLFVCGPRCVISMEGGPSQRYGLCEVRHSPPHARAHTHLTRPVSRCRGFDTGVSGFSAGNCSGSPPPHTHTQPFSCKAHAKPMDLWSLVTGRGGQHLLMSLCHWFRIVVSSLLLLLSASRSLGPIFSASVSSLRLRPS